MSTIEEKVLVSAKPYLENKKIKDLVIGLSMVGCQLSDSSLGLSYVLRYDLPQGCSVFAYTQDVIGKSAWEIANWVISGTDTLQKSIGAAVLSAASESLEIESDNDNSCSFGMDICSNDTVGMIGYIKPVAKVLSSRVKKLIVFDKGISVSGDTCTVCDMSLQPKLLPKCTKMIITGSSTINGTIDGLLEMSSNADQIAIVGSSTPMFKEAFEGTNVVSLAGSWWSPEHKDEIFKIISLAGGISQLKPYMIKKIARI